MTDKIEFTPEFIAAQREIIQSATDGNWRVGMKPEVDGEQDYPGHWVGGYTGRDEYDRDMGVYVLAAFDDGNMTAYEPEAICTPWDESDARLIAEAHNNYPAALDEIERLRAELTDAREMLTEQEGLARAAEERIEDLEAERDELRGAVNWSSDFLHRLARITSSVGAMFFKENLDDDWDAALAWIEKHLSMTPEQSIRERHRETIEGWRNALRDERDKLELAEDECDRLTAWLDKIGQWAGQVDENIHPIAGSLKWAIEQARAGKYPEKGGDPEKSA
jgi:antitoxin component HigA of HigAB toxin-antitoxin module